MPVDGEDVDPWGSCPRGARREPEDPPAPQVRARARGEIKATAAGPIAASLARLADGAGAGAGPLAGFLTEMVGASQMITLAGPGVLVVMYPLGGLGLVVLALLQFRFVDQQARLPMLRAVASATPSCSPSPWS